MTNLKFDNRFTRQLPADPETSNFRRQVHNACFSRVQPTAVSSPKLLAHSKEMADRLGIAVEPSTIDEFTSVFSGNLVLPGMDPFAMCYGGHQFGNWAGQLGDGRAINLGEIVNSQGERWVLQLKGAGPTPYSRTADGLAVLRSSVREFLCSEAMHHLGVPTTRALSLITTGESVMRDMFYDGNARFEPGAVVCRVAPSFIRFGNFQIFTSRGDIDTLKTIIDYTIATDFPELGTPSESTRELWFEQVCVCTAVMINHWNRVGFVHGVMNTDNMSILGLTIDYGPYGWLEDYDPGWTPNTTDAHGKRYAFGQQPQVAFWNLLQLANAILPAFSSKEPLQKALDIYATTINQGWTKMMADKLGLVAYDEEADEQLVEDLLENLQRTETDMTLFYRGLANIPTTDPTPEPRGLLVHIADAFYKPEELEGELVDRIQNWLLRYRERVLQDGRDDHERRDAMNRVNPKFVLRNYLAQMAIDKAEQGDATLIHELLEVLRHPYDDQPDKSMFAEKRPEWARHRAGCSMLSCSS